MKENFNKLPDRLDQQALSLGKHIEDELHVSKTEALRLAVALPELAELPYLPAQLYAAIAWEKMSDDKTRTTESLKQGYEKWRMQRVRARKTSVVHYLQSPIHGVTEEDVLPPLQACMHETETGRMAALMGLDGNIKADLYEARNTLGGKMKKDI